MDKRENELIFNSPVYCNTSYKGVKPVSSITPKNNFKYIKLLDSSLPADAQTRTADLLITNQLLYQLSYIGIVIPIIRGKPELRSSLSLSNNILTKNRIIQAIKKSLYFN